MSTQNICFRGEVRKVFSLYPHLSGAMKAKISSVKYYGTSLYRDLYFCPSTIGIYTAEKHVKVFLFFVCVHCSQRSFHFGIYSVQ